MALMKMRTRALASLTSSWWFTQLRWPNFEEEENDDKGTSNELDIVAGSSNEPRSLIHATD